MTSTRVPSIRIRGMALPVLGEDIADFAKYLRKDLADNIATVSAAATSASASAAAASAAAASALASAGSHAANHVAGGGDEIDGDMIDVDYPGTGYTPSTAVGYSTAAGQLASHLKGIGTAITAAQSSADTHASRHVSGAADEVDGDRIDIDGVPTHYTRTADGVIATTTAHAWAHFNGIDTALATKLLRPTSKKTADYTATAGELVLVDMASASGNVTITAPAAAANLIFGVKVTSYSSRYTCTVQRAGSDTLDVLDASSSTSVQVTPTVDRVVVFYGASSSWVTAGVPSAWETIYSIDFTAQSNQSLADGNNTIAGKTFVAINIATSGGTIDVVNGSGLKLTTSAVSANAWGNAAPTTAVVSLPMAQVNGYDPTREQLFQVYLTIGSPAANQGFQCGFCQYDTAANIAASQLACAQVGTTGNMWSVYCATNGSSTSQTLSDVWTIHRKAEMIGQYLMGTYSSGFPAFTSLTPLGSVHQNAIVVQARNPKGFAMGATRNAGGSYTAYVKALRIMQK